MKLILSCKRMTKKQRESTTKYLYDISKGIALVAIVGNFIKDKWETFAAGHPFEYKFLDDDLSPYALLDIGYVYYNSESVVTPPRSGILVDTIEEIPEEYRNPIPHLRKSGTFLGAGIGAGLKYKLSTATEIMITYVFRYNNKIINSNNILLGISF